MFGLIDKNIWSYSPEEYQQLFGVIFQDYIRYHFTARENIAIGKINDLDNLERIKYASERSLANQVVEDLPLGFEQQLGKRFHNGIDLSGGQWQKIALARAYMKDSEIVILDEPTSALDARAEFNAFQRFTEFTQGKMAILISHRFSTVRMADHIIVLQGGRIIESGTHLELVKKNGLYSELFNFQATGYK